MEKTTLNFLSFCLQTFSRCLPQPSPPRTQRAQQAREGLQGAKQSIGSIISQGPFGCNNIKHKPTSVKRRKCLVHMDQLSRGKVFYTWRLLRRGGKHYFCLSAHCLKRWLHPWLVPLKSQQRPAAVGPQASLFPSSKREAMSFHSSPSSKECAFPETPSRLMGCNH